MYTVLSCRKYSYEEWKEKEMELAISLIGIFVALAILAVLCFKGCNPLLAALVSVAVMCVTSGLDVVQLITGDFAKGLTGFMFMNFFVFIMCAVFGKFMEASGASVAVSQVFSKLFSDRYAIYGIMVATAVLTYGGVSIFVIVFTVYPMYLYAFQRANLPRKLIPAAVAASGTSFACTMIPGTPQNPNLIPGNLLGTPPTAAPLLSIICTVICIILLVIYFEWQFNKCRKAGEGFDTTPEVEKRINDYLSAPPVKHAWLAFIPMAVFLIVLNLFKQHCFVAGVAGIIATCILFPKTIGGFKGFSELFTKGIDDAKMAMFSTAAIVAVADVVKLTGGFQHLVSLLGKLNGNPYIVFVIAVIAIAAMCGAGGAGSSVAINLFAGDMIAKGCAPELIHRIASISCDVFDNMPHNGFIITMLTVCGLTHKEAYKYIFIVSSVIPLIMTIFATIVGPLLY